MKLLTCLTFALALGAGGLFAQNSAEQTRLLRFPATNGAQIVFSYTGQLYTVDVTGGTARRLTDAPGWAVFPRFSADGAQLAFTAQYDGNTEVYVMPSEGGTPRRLTYTATLSRDDLSDRMGPNNIVMAWKNRSPELAFRSRWRDPNDFLGQLYTVGLDGEIPQQLPVPRGGFMSYSPDDTKMAYNRVFREFRTWKRYRGGMADDVWIIDFKTGALENITNHPAQDIIPMWAPNGKIYFLSDRGGNMNLYSYELASKRTTQHTQFKDFDVKFPSLGKGGIVFEQAGLIWHFDLKTESARQVPIVVREDLAIARGGMTHVSRFVAEVNPSPDGKRAVVTARGETFTVPVKNGPVRNLSNTPGVHERDATWSPDGRWIAYISDATGENEIWTRAQDGSGEPVQVTSNSDTYFYGPIWSPDSKKLLWGDREQRLRFVDVESKNVTEIEKNPTGEITNFDWSPDNKWIAWASPQRGSYAKVKLYSVETKSVTDVTDGWFSARGPSFSDDGKWLLFASGRDFTPTYGVTEFNHIYRDWERVYLVALAKDTKSPFAPKSDEVEIAKDDEKPGAKAAAKSDTDAPKTDDAKPVAVADTPITEKKETPASGEKKDAKKKPIVVKVDLDGLKDRTIALPITASNYPLFTMVGDKVFYLRTTGGFGGPGGAGGTLFVYNLKDLKETELGTVNGFSITADGKKMLVRQQRDYAIIDLPNAKIDVKEKLNLAGLEMQLDRTAEWNQIYHESWRQMRDFLYAPNMHGVDWPLMRQRYATLLPSVKHRNDLSFVIGELIGELNVGHAYVGGGERLNEAPRVQVGLLGAEFSRDAASRAYRIDRILRGENWQTNVRSPLTEIGVDVKEGDFIVAVDGKPVSALSSLHAAFVGTVGKHVTLRVNSTPTTEGARDVVVVPIANEQPLYYYNWVQKNIDYVSQKTNGEVGYIHIPNMGQEGLNEFVKHYYPQLGKRALIVDDRGNGGGNVSPQIAERLSRELLFVSIGRNGQPNANPGGQLVGPKVLLLNEFSASDGDIFAFRFRAMNLGKIIGKRSWGGVVGIRGTLPFVDGGTLNRPEFANGYSADGKEWIMEGEGVTPDIIVDNDPWKEFHGEDQQLDAAIAHILQELKTKGRDIPPPPPYPIRN
ncbi:MAG: PDZ domain-containing protein [Candidatus Didemnitutus sp.]|nr:PDZ domain-containing protein [Candidatus Didemnitutus sp.]